MLNLAAHKVTTRLYSGNLTSSYNFSSRYLIANSPHTAEERVAVLSTSAETGRGTNNPTEGKNEKHDWSLMQLGTLPRRPAPVARRQYRVSAFRYQWKFPFRAICLLC
jgi:hypothetical protein